MGVRDPKEKVKKLGKEFSPEKILENLNKQAEEQENEKWHSYKIKLITPIFGGGVKAGEPDIKMPVRASAIRGQLRYWWRFLAANRPDKPLAEKKLFEEERDIWGGMSEYDKDYSSKVKLRIKKILFSKKEIKPCAKYIPKKKKNEITGKYEETEKLAVRYEEKIPEYAMFPGRGELNDDQESVKQGKEPADMIFRLVFILEISIDQDENGNDKISFKDDVEPALRWWASFGGLGARTRRGVGAIKITCEHGNVLTVSDDEIEKHQCQRECLPPQNDSFEAWKISIRLLQEFRQLYPKREGRKIEWIGIGRDKKIDRRFKNNEGPSVSRWPEPHAIRKTTKERGRHPPPPDAPVIFPRALFGMPLAFPFMSDYRKPAETKLLPKKKGKKPYERFASPLIIKPVATEDGKFQPTALLMPYCHLCDLQLSLAYQDNSEEWIFEPDEWCDRTQAEVVDPIKENNGTDALTAFMNFFAKGGIK